MTFRTPEQDRITRRGLADARAALAAAGRPTNQDQRTEQDPTPPERRNP